MFSLDSVLDDLWPSGEACTCKKSVKDCSTKKNSSNLPRHTAI